MADNRTPAARRRRRLYEPPPPETSGDVAGAAAAGERETRAEAARADAARMNAAVTVTPAPNAVHPIVGKEAEAARIVKKYVGWAAGVGWLPILLVGTASVVGVQLKMLSELSALYGVPFSRERGRALIATIAGGAGAVEIGKPVLAPFVAMLLPIGWPVLSVAASTAASASTYAIGRVFTQHFELGGTLLNFRPEETRAFFEAQRRKERGGTSG